MSVNSNQTPSDSNILLFPRDPSAGALGNFAKYGRLDEIKNLESTRDERLWEVRAFVSDTVPLAGDAAEAMARPYHHKLVLNESPLFIYLHKGGRNAVYYELVGDKSNQLSHITVRVRSRFPSNALLLARAPVNALLDVLTRDYSLPLVIQRLELMSPGDGGILITEMLIPARNGVAMGPLGGVIQAVPFAPYDALYREALICSSPFYRLLCAWKMYEGTNQLRRWIRKMCEAKGVTERMPSDPDVNPEELIRIGFDPSFVSGIKKAGDLFKSLGDQRDAIAHFLVDKDGTESHVYVADGRQLHQYAIGAAALLRYAHRVLEDLRLFYIKHLGATQGGMILPTPEHRDQFAVKATDFGLE